MRPRTSTVTSYLPLLILAVSSSPNVASANAISSATSIFNYPDWASSTCKYGSNMFETPTVNWRTALSSHGASMSAHDATIFWEELTDPDFDGNDADDGNLDTADIAFLGTHGSGERYSATGVNCYTTNDSSCDYVSWYALLTTTSRNPSASCYANTDDIALGDGNLEYLDVFSCESLEIRGGDYQLASSYKLHQWHGFSGIMASGTGTSDKTDDYIDDAFDGSAAVAWVDNLTSWDHWGSTADVCAVSFVRGNSSSDVSNRLVYERYGTGSYSDPTGSYYTHLYYTTCDPPSPIPGTMGEW